MSQLFFLPTTQKAPDSRAVTWAGRGCDFDTAAERVEDLECLAQLSSGFSRFELYQEPDSDSSRGGQLLLPQVLSYAGRADVSSDFYRCHLVFPIGNIIASYDQIGGLNSRSGIKTL
jgi:hypothetical protein